MTTTGNNTVTNVDAGYEGNPHMEKLLAALVSSEDFKRATGSMIHVMMNQWAGESSAKKWIVSPLEKRLKKALLKPAESGNGAQGASIISLIDPVAGLMSEMLGRMSEFAKSIEELPSEEKAKLIEKISGNFNTEQLGDMMGSLSRIIKTDERIGIAPLINTGAKKLLDIVTRYNQNFSEESSGNSGSSSFNFDAVDGATIGKLLNQCIKVIKKVRKKTEHLKDSSFLDTESVLLNKVEEIGSEIDIGFLMQSRMAFDEYKQSFKSWLMS